MDNKKIGIALSGLGVVILIWATFIFDTTVPIDAYTRIHNLGLLDERRNYMTLGGVILGVGIFFLHKSGVFNNATKNIDDESTKPIKSQHLKNSEINEEIWTQAANEFNSSSRNEGLWAKSLAQNYGDENKAKASYLNFRVNQIAQQNLSPSQERFCISCQKKIGAADEYCFLCGVSQTAKSQNFKEKSNSFTTPPIESKIQTSVKEQGRSHPSKIAALVLVSLVIVSGLIYVAKNQNKSGVTGENINYQSGGQPSGSTEYRTVQPSDNNFVNENLSPGIYVSIARNQPTHTAKALLSELAGRRVWKYGYIQENQLTATSTGEILIGPFDYEDDAKKVQDSFYNTPYAQDILIVRK